MSSLLLDWEMVCVKLFHTEGLRLAHWGFSALGLDEQPRVSGT